MANKITSKFGHSWLVVGSLGQMTVVDFDGVKFFIDGGLARKNWLPSWILFKEPNFFYTANPVAQDTLHLKFRPGHFVSSANGSGGGVHLEFNADKTRMVEASLASNTIDIWDISAPDGSLRLMKSLPVPGNPADRRGRALPHQAVLDPTGRFFVIPNLIGDSLVVLDAKDDLYEITHVAFMPPHVGPRHVAFLTSEGTHYLVMVAEFTNEIFLFEAEYVVDGVADTIHFKEIQRQTTCPSPDLAAPGLKLAEVEVARNQRDVYVSNRMTGGDTDHIAHFAFSRSGDGTARLDYVSRASSGGRAPRSFCLSLDAEQNFLFVANEAGENGLVALKRDPETGVLDPNPVATLLQRDLRDSDRLDMGGPHFVREFQFIVGG
ncbi:acetyl-CoA hydrolase [Hypoxylon texense]